MLWIRPHISIGKTFTAHCIRNILREGVASWTFMLYICCKCCIPEVTFVSFQQRFFVWQNGKWTSFLISRRTGWTVCDGRLWKQQLSPGPWPSHGNKMEFCGFYFKERQLQWSWGSVRIAPSAQHYWKGSAHTAKTVPSHFLINVPLYHWILHLLRFVGFHIWGQILFWLTLCAFPGRISPHWEAPDPWGSSSKQAVLISSRMERQTTALAGNQLLSTSAAHFCMTWSAFGQEYLGPKAVHCQIQQSRGFYLQCHYFLFLCVCTVN